MRVLHMTVWAGGKRYATGTSVVLAHGTSDSDRSWVQGAKQYVLFRTSDGRYFAQVRAQVGEGGTHGDLPWIEPLSEVQAIPLYWELAEKFKTFEEAFPAGR